MSITPTPYADVNAILTVLLTDIRAVLGEYFVGMYLHGSLALGDFVPDRSDIDFVVVTTELLPETIVAALAMMHDRIAACGMPWAHKIEGIYIPRAVMRRHDPATAYHPRIGTGEPFVMEQNDAAGVIMRHILLESGVVLIGPALNTLIDPVSADEVRQAVRDIFQGWWVPLLAKPILLQQDGYRTYAILTMCRMLYTLEHGTVVSKAAAARWALSALDVRWTPLIERALAWPHSDQPDNREETIAFIHYTAARIN